MNTSTVSKIEESIFALPASEQRRLIARVSKALRKSDADALDGQLLAMANDTDIQREIDEINREFRITEMDGLD